MTCSGKKTTGLPHLRFFRAARGWFRRSP